MALVGVACTLKDSSCASVSAAVLSKGRAHQPSLIDRQLKATTLFPDSASYSPVQCGYEGSNRSLECRTLKTELLKYGRNTEKWK